MLCNYSALCINHENEKITREIYLYVTNKQSEKYNNMILKKRVKTIPQLKLSIIMC